MPGAEPLVFLVAHPRYKTAPIESHCTIDATLGIRQIGTHFEVTFVQHDIWVTHPS
jgi:hypothetical protein